LSTVFTRDEKKFIASNLQWQTCDNVVQVLVFDNPIALDDRRMIQ